METPKYRLLTRSDFDGLVCAVLLKELDLIEEIKFVHPKDVQDGKIEITGRDILTNLPYVPACHLCFDHHDSEEIRTEGFLELICGRVYADPTRAADLFGNGMPMTYDIDTIAADINNRPRKRLGYLTPLESFNKLALQ